MQVVKFIENNNITYIEKNNGIQLRHKARWLARLKPQLEKPTFESSADNIYNITVVNKMQHLRWTENNLTQFNFKR